MSYKFWLECEKKINFVPKLSWAQLQNSSNNKKAQPIG